MAVRVTLAICRTSQVILGTMLKRDSRMPRFRPMAKLERSALADLCKHTLSRIPTVRAAYLSCDSSRFEFRHIQAPRPHQRRLAGMKLCGPSGKVITRRFSSGCSYRSPRKTRICGIILRASNDPQEEIVQHWLKSGIYRSYVPACRH